MSRDIPGNELPERQQFIILPRKFAKVLHGVDEERFKTAQLVFVEQLDVEQECAEFIRRKTMYIKDSDGGVHFLPGACYIYGGSCHAIYVM